MTARGRSPRRSTHERTAEDRAVALVEANAADVLAYLQRRTSSPEDAADVLGDALVVAWRRIADLPQDDERARMWLFVTARGALSNHHRGRRRASGLTERLREEVAAQVRTAGAGVQDEVADVVRAAVEQLPAAQRELVTLVHWDGFTLAQAAEVVGVPASTARSRYAAARADLARRLTGAPDAPGLRSVPDTPVATQAQPPSPRASPAPAAMPQCP